LVISAHDTGKTVAVGDADGEKPKFIGSRGHLLRMRGPAQEGEVGGHGQLGISGHFPPPTRVALARARVQACWGRVGWGVARRRESIDACEAPPDPHPPPTPPHKREGSLLPLLTHANSPCTNQRADAVSRP